MDAKEIRVSNLRALVAEVGTIAAFARLHPEIDATYVSQLLNGHRSFGEKAARTMEAKLGIAPGSLDQSTASLGPAEWPFPRLIPEQYQRLKQSQKDAIEDWVLEQVARFLDDASPTGETAQDGKAQRRRRQI